MRIVFFTVGLLAAGLSAPLAAATVPKPPAQISSPIPAADLHRQACDDLASIIINNANTLPQVDTFLTSFSAAMKPGDRSIGDLDARFPGLRPKVISAMRPMLVRNANERIPLYRADVSALYCANLTTAEARKAAIGMRQPAFQAFIGSAVKNINYDSVTKEVMQDRDVTASGVSATYRASGARVAKAMTPTQLAVVGAFLQSPVGRKLAALNPQKAVIDAKWFNYSDPAKEREIEAIVSDTIVAHVALTDKAAAERMRVAMANPEAKSQ